MPYSLIVDVLVAVLLVITIGYAIVLNKRLGKLRRDKADLERLATTFGESTARAEESIESLKSSAAVLQEHMDHAQALRDDLAFLIDRGGKAADNLEDLVRDVRDRIGVGPRPGAVMPSREPADTAPPNAAGREHEEEPQSDAERELLKAIRSAG